ncbi:MAG: right-handed parallel beta-helix repeat-containing protein [Bryobacterales bacterium]|nr:right-handed parallel beta-helix repeat-containing protein [Bryobacterales bacterium]
MKRAIGGAVFPFLFLFTYGCSKPERTIQKAIDAGSGTVELPAGTTELQQELRISSNGGPLEIVGSSDTILKPGGDFQGRALIVIEGANKVTLRDFAIDGSRAELQRPTEAPVRGSDYGSQFQRNGVYIGTSQEVTVRNVRFREILNFAILANNAKKLKVENVAVEDSGGRDSKSRNNGSGGILVEEGSQDFEIRNCTVRRVLGNGIWTHASSFAKRNLRGVIAGNRIETVGRHGIEVGHANGVRVENNSLQLIGYPSSAVDVEAEPPAAFASAARVDESAFVGNSAAEINGRCFSLDGFHDGEVTRNTCKNRSTDLKEYPRNEYAMTLGNTYPEMQSQNIKIVENMFDGFRLGGLYLIGENHQVTGNTFQHLNLGKCTGEEKPGCPVLEKDPDYPKAGIYLAFRAARPNPSRNNTIEKNRIEGFRMKENCILTGPSIKTSENTISGNTCSNTE